jgi:transposase
MEQKQKQSTGNFIKDIRRNSRRLFLSEQKQFIVMEAHRSESSVREI